MSGWWRVSYSLFAMHTLLDGITDAVLFVMLDIRSKFAAPGWAVVGQVFQIIGVNAATFHEHFQCFPVAFLLTSCATFITAKFPIEELLRETFIRHSGNMTGPSEL